jgi:hypothetical protein
MYDQLTVAFLFKCSNIPLNIVIFLLFESELTRVHHFFINRTQNSYQVVQQENVRDVDMQA